LEADTGPTGWPVLHGSLYKPTQLTHEKNLFKKLKNLVRVKKLDGGEGIKTG
jgi:hypothetical protein